MEPAIPARSTQIGQDARGVIGQTVIGATVIYGSVTIIQGSQAAASHRAVSPAATDDTTTAAPTSAEQGPNPYQGLLAFQPSDGDRFFGRAAEIENLWQRFRGLHEQADATRLLVVYGPSGSGKSSLVRAGLVPELARRPPGGRAQARIALLVPGSQPLQALASVLARIATNDPAPVRKTREFAEELALANGAGEHDGLQRIAAVLPEADVWPLVVVVDQLEELYSLCPDAAERHAFLGNLLHAAADRSGQVEVLVTLRSDFLGATQADPALNQLIQAQGVFVAALSEQGLRDAIRLPAERRNRSLDAATVDLLVEQSLGRDGALPLLQFALLRIWEGLLRGQPAAETLRQIGGVGGALAGEADRIFASLPEGDQRIARRLFLNLVQLGEGSCDTRRRVDLQEVIAHGEDPAATQRVIERFASPAVRLITRSSGQDGRETLELSHEALIEAWPLLREWLNSSRADLRFQRRLEDIAGLWENGGKPEGRLWRPPDLDVLNQFREEHEAELTSRQLAFAEASRRAEQQRLRQEKHNRRLVFSGLAGGLAVVSVALLLAWGQLVRAQRQRGEALAATAKLTATTRPADALLEALAAAGFSRYGQLQPASSLLPDTAREALLDGAARNREQMQLRGHQGGVFSAAYSADGSRIVSAGRDGTVRQWEAKSGRAIGEPLRGHQGGVWTAAYSADGSRIVSAGDDGTVRQWEAKSGRAIGEPLRGHQGWARSAAYSADGSRIVSAGLDGTVRQWEAKSGRAIGEPLRGHQGGVLSAAYSADGSRIVSAGRDGTVRQWEAKSGRAIG
jgi:hypothetical protein